MADDIAVTAGTGTTVATDDIGGRHFQRIKTTWGPDGTANDADVATGKPMPIQLRGSDGTDRSNELPVAIASGKIASGAIASGAIASGAFASGAIGSGAVASGAVASGAVASGAFASGSVADGAMVTFGAKADAKATATDTTSITFMQVAKQISASVQALATAIGSTLWDLGVGTSGTRTQRIAIDTSQVPVLGRAAMTASMPVIPAGYEYETVAASQTAQVLGPTGATGDMIAGVLVVPATTSPGNVLLLDNATSITVFVGGASSVSNLVPFLIPLNLTSVSGAWKLSTGANVSCIGIGDFT